VGVAAFLLQGVGIGQLFGVEGAPQVHLGPALPALIRRDRPTERLHARGRALIDGRQFLCHLLQRMRHSVATRDGFTRKCAKRIGYSWPDRGHYPTDRSNGRLCSFGGIGRASSLQGNPRLPGSKHQPGSANNERETLVSGQTVPFSCKLLADRRPAFSQM
jgi:hypothetical protein